MVQPELVLIVLAALAPAVVAGAVLAAAARPDGRTWIGALVAFAWGAVIATSVASLLNDAAAARLPALAGEPGARVLLPALLAPTIEELAKAAGFLVVGLVARGALGSVRSAIAIGALIGFGFAVAENVGYYLLAAVQGGYDGLGRAVYLRGVVQSANHAVFTATVGVAVGAARPGRSRTGMLALGLAAAVTLHAIWNASVSRAISTVLCNAPVSGGACAPAPDAGDLLLVVPGLEAAFLIPILAVLAWLARRR